MIALIAGTGDLPLQAVHALNRCNRPFFTISLFPEQNMNALSAAGAQDLIPQSAYRLGTILETLKNKKTTQLLFAGKVDKRLLLKNLEFDWLALKLLGATFYKSDREIMETLLGFLREQNIEVLSQAEVFGTLFAAPGVLCGTLTNELKRDIELGLTSAQTMSLHDIGQTVVVKDNMIIAVEAIEGTDECIDRALSLAGPGIVVCKAARLDQNKKYDLPTLGPTSLERFKPNAISAVAWQASQTIILEKDILIMHAHERGITLFAR